MTAYAALLRAGFRRQGTYLVSAFGGLTTNLFWGTVRTLLFLGLYRGQGGAGEVNGLLLTQGDRVRDTTAEGKPTIKLPSEHNGLAMVFLTFERVSYALLLDVRTGVRVGDRLVNPQ